MCNSTNKTQIILASTSRTRQKILSEAGVSFDTVPSLIDEEFIKTECIKDGDSAGEIAMALASRKALSVSVMYPEKLVIGADQVLEFNGQAFSKPKNTNMAIKQLKELRGNVHYLINSVSLAIGGCQTWSYTVKCKMKMRNVSDTYIKWYIGKVGHKALETPGSYQIEGLGIQLFEELTGDHSSILGLPLLPLLNFLRDRKYIKS